MRVITFAMPAILALAVGLGAAACDRTISGAKKDAADIADEAKKDSASASAKAGAAMETFDVKKALVADTTVDASDINVDTFAETKTVVLKGTVPTAEQRDQAERIALREAVGYKVENQLIVKAK